MWEGSATAAAVFTDQLHISFDDIVSSLWILEACWSSSCSWVICMLVNRDGGIEDYSECICCGLINGPSAIAI